MTDLMKMIPAEPRTGFPLEERVERIITLNPDSWSSYRCSYEWLYMIMAILRDQTYNPDYRTVFYKMLLKDEKRFQLLRPWLAVSGKPLDRILRTHEELEKLRDRTSRHT